MGDTLAQIEARPLRMIAMPGAHDAGMSVLTASSDFSTSCNTQTQTVPISEQLQAGARYFDFRPVTWNGEADFYHGHFSAFEGKYFGSIGQSLSTAVGEIASFLEMPACSKEVVILKLSHYTLLEKCLDTADLVVGQPFEYENFQALADAVLTLNQNLFTSSGSTSLNDVVLSEVTSGTSGRVMVVFDLCGGSNTGYPLSLVAPEEGCFSYNNAGSGDADLVVFDEYYGSDDLAGMDSNQQAKFQSYSPAPGLSFLLSWTLTQTDPVLEPCILDLADTANGALVSAVQDWVDAETITATKIPSIVETDNLTDACVALQACVSLNYLQS